MSKDELIEKTDSAISELVRDRPEIRKAYNYYNGIRDADQFKYIEENFGLGTPTSIEFTPLVKKHIDALIGEYLGVPILPKITCKDEKTITNIFRDKQLKIEQEIHNLLSSKLQNSIFNILDGKSEDVLIKKEIEDIKEDINNNFISEYEIAAQNLIEYIMQSRETDMDNVKRHLIFDLLVTGYSAYKTEPSIGKNNIKLKVLDINNVFADKNPESPYLKDSYRIVVRHWLSKSQILHQYNDELKSEDKKYIKEHWDDIFSTNSNAYYVEANSTGIIANQEVGIYPGFSSGTYQKLVPVYEVEWIETDDDGTMQRYETIRIGEDIYIPRGKNTKVVRSISNPKYCSLSVNGVFFINRSQEPISLMLQCAHLQDKIFVLIKSRELLETPQSLIGLDNQQLNLFI